MTTLAAPRLRSRILSSFDDPTELRNDWYQLLDRGRTNAINLTWEWQRNWWEFFGRGQLMLVTIEKRGRPSCIAPLFADDGMVFNICPEDHLDLVGDVTTESVEAILNSALDAVQHFQGLRLYFVPKSSPTAGCLQIAAEKFGMICIEESCIPSP